MPRLYRIDVKVCATAYIKAKSQAEAVTKAKALKGRCIYSGLDEFDIPISGLAYDDPALPTLSVSPAMTCHGIWEGGTIERADE